jgi:uncharacterized FAD-dependent dehydrogenase
MKKAKAGLVIENILSKEQAYIVYQKNGDVVYNLFKAKEIPNGPGGTWFIEGGTINPAGALGWVVTEVTDIQHAITLGWGNINIWSNIRLEKGVK